MQVTLNKMIFFFVLEVSFCLTRTMYIWHEISKLHNYKTLYNKLTNLCILVSLKFHILYKIIQTEPKLTLYCLFCA